MASGYNDSTNHGRSRSDIDGRAKKLNGAFRENDIESNTAREAASELGGSEFQTSGANESTLSELRFDPDSAARCT